MKSGTLSDRFYPLWNKCAFTMVEILLVMGLLATISLAVFNTLSNGLKIWKRGYQAVGEEDLMIFFDKLAHDAHNTFEFSKLTVKGESRLLELPTIVRTPADLKSDMAGTYVEQIGKVKYYFDPAQRAIFRCQANYSQALKETYDPARQLVGDIRSIQFRYYYARTDQLPWHPQTDEHLPSAIEVTVQYGTQQHPQSIVKLISIPVGS